MGISPNSGLSLSIALAAITIQAAQAEGAFDWTWRNPLPNGESVRGAVWTGSQVVAVGMFWTEKSSSALKDFNAICWTGSRLVAAGDDGTLLTSTDGAAWTARTPPRDRSLHAVVHVEERLLVLADGGGHLYSADGVTWFDTTLSSGSGGRDAEGRKARLVTMDGAVVGEPESVSATGARFSVQGIPRGVYFVQWESAGRKEARAVKLAR